MNTQIQYTIKELLTAPSTITQSKDEYITFLKAWKEVYKYVVLKQTISKYQSRITSNITDSKEALYSGKISLAKSRITQLSASSILNFKTLEKELIKLLPQQYYTTPQRNNFVTGYHALCIKLLDIRTKLKQQLKSEQCFA
jgi:hypothetical protein